MIQREKFDEERPRMSAADFASALDELGLSSTEASKRLGVSPRTLRRWLSGEEEVSLSVEGYVKFAVNLIWLKRQWFEKYGLTVQVGVTRTVLLDLLGSDYPELHAVEPEGDDAVLDEIDDDDEEVCPQCGASDDEPCLRDRREERCWYGSAEDEDSA
jgi:hypothetical protein